MRVRRGLTGLLAASLLTVGPVQGAQAHCHPIKIVPADQSTVTTVPTEFVMTLSEDMVPSGSAMQIDGPNGQVPVQPKPDGIHYSTALPANLANGTYLVTWRLAGVSGSIVSGNTTFTVQAGGNTQQSALASTQTVGAVNSLQGAVAAAPQDASAGEQAQLPLWFIALSVAMALTLVAALVLAMRRARRP